MRRLRPSTVARSIIKFRRFCNLITPQMVRRNAPTRGLELQPDYQLAPHAWHASKAKPPRPHTTIIPPHNRHRGQPLGCSPATPPGMRVRTGRLEWLRSCVGLPHHAPGFADLGSAKWVHSLPHLFGLHPYRLCGELHSREHLIPICIKNDNCVASPCRAAALSAASRLVLFSNANWNEALPF